MHILAIAHRGITILAIALTSPAWAVNAVITACHDGDTCTAIATKDAARLSVRLHEVDAPELDQPFGTQARTLVSALVIGRHVDLRLAGYSQDRLVADMVLRDGRSVAALLVAEGATLGRPRTTDERRQPVQAAAQQARRGFWRDASAAPPWEWRQRPAQGPAPKRSWWSRAWS
jgi:endonuclease YncB( thermonuclease family)